MSDQWDFYFARIDEAVSSIFVDLGVKAEAPIEKRPWLLWLWIGMRAPKEDGLASNEETPALHAIGEALDSTVSATCGGQLVGRVTGKGRREFYFYAAEPGELAAAVEGVMQNFPGYHHESGSTFQPDWDQYFTLYPSASNLERMRNRRTLASLARDGDVHETPRTVEHWFSFANPDHRDTCRDTLIEIEFTLEDESESDDLAETLPYVLVVSRVDSIDSHTINGITIELSRLARECRGRYDGWECAVTQAALPMAGG